MFRANCECGNYEYYQTMEEVISMNMAFDSEPILCNKCNLEMDIIAVSNEEDKKDDII